MPLHQQDFSGALRAVAIFGPGLLGGSLGLALASKLPGLDLRFWTRSSSLQRVRRLFAGATDSPREAVEGADAVVLCTPAGVMPELAEEIRPSLDPDCLVTDVASTKRRIAACLGGVLGGQYVPAHPMAGSELAGIEAARADLFEDALCLLTPDGEVPEAFVARAEHLWRSVGCRTRRIGAAEHDRLVARVSHLPHAVASALVSTVAASAPEAFPVAAGGFRDTTRVAGGPAAMWAEIFLDNREEVLAALAEFGRSLGALGDLLRHGDREGIEAMLEGARAERERLP